MKKMIIVCIMTLLLLTSVSAVIRINNALNLITGGAGNFTNLTVNGQFMLGSGLFAGNITSDGSNFIFNIPNGTLQVNTNLSVSREIYVGNNGTDGDKWLYFYEGTPTGVYIKWQDSSSALTTAAGFTASGTLTSDADIRTTGAGDDLWLGTGTQASSNFRAYADGTLCLQGFCGNKILYVNETYQAQTSTVTTYAAVANLSFALSTTGKDIIKCELDVQTAATTTGAWFNTSMNGSSAGRVTYQYLNASGDPVEITDTTLYTSTIYFKMEPADWRSTVTKVIISAQSTRNGAGVFQVNYATEVGASGNTVNSGSYCTYLDG
jgi:hypothetical protein